MSSQEKLFEFFPERDGQPPAVRRKVPFTEFDRQPNTIAIIMLATGIVLGLAALIMFSFQ